MYRCAYLSAIAKHNWNVIRFCALIIVKYILSSCVLKFLLKREDSTNKLLIMLLSLSTMKEIGKRCENGSRTNRNVVINVFLS